MRAARILVVEDDRIVSRDIQEQLKRIGHSVAAATPRGEDAIALAAEHRPDLVLMDIRLEGEVDGIDAAEAIRTNSRLPVLFLTAYADEETVVRASRAEPFGYLLKPFDESQLRTAIEIALYKHDAEQRLAASERRYATTLASIGDAVIACDIEANITFLNPVAEQLTGWTVAEALGHPIVEIFHIINEDSRQVVEDPAGKVLRLGTTVGLANHTILIAKDGREVPIDDCGSPIIGEHGEMAGAVLVFRDIGPRRRMDEALQEAQSNLAMMARMTRLGELAASIAHELNQPLTAIVSNAETCLRYLDEPHLDEAQRHEARQAAERLIGNGQRAGDILRSIRNLVSRSTHFGGVDLNAIIREVADLLRGELRRKDCKLELDLSTDLRSVWGDRTQLQQVALNLIMNAIEAMANVDDRRRLVMVTTRNASPSTVELGVEDAGTGLPFTPEDAFEPLFTTKREGMGLGLSICHSIIEAHRGTIAGGHRSDGTSGARFTITVPTNNDR
ncbi:response regulator [Novosphingobium sp. AP12]|uniref:ATP-binding response regulator n=1 Tax=Novosphingobium sp. AP12 TaxID=1144305 RepID=UPI000271E210|nr:response regulator [Novosphingobium sp. AP12]EJL33389.1 PAS domain S-box [Novosphingobium sp. AP12]